MTFTVRQQIILLKLSFYSQSQTEYAIRHFEYFIEEARQDTYLLDLLNKVVINGLHYETSDLEYFCDDEYDEVLAEGSL